MAGEIEAAREGMALAKEAMPLVKEIMGMFRELMDGMGNISPTPAPTPAPGPASDDQTAVLKRIATALEGIQAALDREK